VASKATLPCTLDGVTTSIPAIAYHATIIYFSTWPVTSGSTPLACTPGSGLLSTPKGALIVSKGQATGNGIRSVVRQMESLVRLSQANEGTLGIPAVIFANGNMTDSNALTVGATGNDANVYVKGDWTCSGGASVAGSVYVQGHVTTSGTCTAASDVWANGSVVLNGFTLGHDLTSSTSTVSLQGSTFVGHNVKSGTTCSGCTTGSGGRVGGTVTTNSPSGAPPIPLFPQLTYTGTEWTDDGYTVQDFSGASACTNAQTVLGQTPVGTTTNKLLLHISGGCSLGMPATVTLGNNVAVFTDGAINVSGAVTYKSSVAGTRHTFYGMVGYVDPATCTNAKIIKYTNVMTFTDTDAFFYTPCDLSITNKTPGLTGQLFGKNVTTSNQFQINNKAISLPGHGSTTGFQVDIAYVRETQPS
jgi:hypothetical protein